MIVLNKNHPLLKTIKQKGGYEISDLLPFKQVQTKIPITSSKSAETIDFSTLGVDHQLRSASPIITPYFLSVPILLTNPDHYAVLTESVADIFVKLSQNLTKIPMPKGGNEKGKRTMLFWSDFGVSDPAIQWLRSLLLSQ